jgi:aspartate aminotransferase
MMTDTAQAAPSIAALAADPGRAAAGRTSKMAAGLVGSEILRIAGEIRALVASGRRICDLTVGDFDPRYFPIPDLLRDATSEALLRGETNYPPSNGIADLREAVARWYARDLGLDYPATSTVIASGSRPIIYALFRAVCDPGDRVVYPVPSWNNNHYAHLVAAEGVPITCTAADNFLPRRGQIAPLLAGARLLCLNSPLNPTGTAFTADALRGIVEEVVAENRRRESSGERPLFLMYDHVYWTLCFGGTAHVTPPELVAESARHTIFVDGISKAFAATGVRVGWGVGPADIIAKMSSILGHMGAWAPRAEQVGTVALLDDPRAMGAYQDGFKRGIQARLDRMHDGLAALAARGLPVECIPPMGAIYLTARFDLFGRGAAGGSPIRTNDDVRRYLLEAAGVAVVPFQAFGCPGDDGWFRLSIGAVSLDDVDEALPRLERALLALR